MTCYTNDGLLTDKLEPVRKGPAVECIDHNLYGIKCSSREWGWGGVGCAFVRACVCVCARARVCVCVCVCSAFFVLFVFIILYVNCFGRTVLYMCIEYKREIIITIATLSPLE